MEDEARLRQLLARPEAVASSDYDLNPGIALAPDRRLRPAAVLVAVRLDARCARVILTKRSSHLQHHPGQVAFPGGKIEADDPSPEGAALRESAEEIGLGPGLVTVLGRLPAHETVTGFSVTPVVGVIRGDFRPRPRAGEVEEVFDVPLSHVLDPANYRVEGRLWQGQLRRYYTVPFGPYYIWGATARILRSLAGPR